MIELLFELKAMLSVNISIAVPHAQKPRLLMKDRFIALCQLKTQACPR